MTGWIIGGIILWAIGALIVGVAYGSAGNEDRAAVWLGFTWPYQLIATVLGETYKRIPKYKKRDKDWREDDRRVLHRRYPIELYRADGAWNYKIGRHTDELLKSKHAYLRLEYCKEAALAAHQDWELEQARKMAQ